MKKRLNLEDRMIIQELLRLGYKLKDIAKTVDSYPSTVSREIKKRRKGNEKTLHCPKTDRYPFVCNNCSKKSNCNMKRYYYSYKEAHKDYRDKLKYSRIGIDMSIDEIEYWNDYFRDRLKDKNQPILHIFKNIEDSFPKSLQTFYSYVHKVTFPLLMMRC